MSRLRTPSSTTVAVTVLAALTSVLTLLSWDGLSDDASAYLVPLFFLSVLVGALGLGLRAARVPTGLVPVVQVVAVAAVLHHVWAGDVALKGWLPTGDSLRAVGRVLSAASAASQDWAAPVPATVTEFAPLMVLCGVVVILLVDLLACTLRRVPLTGLPLLAAFTAPVSVVDGVSWVTFAAAAAGFVLLLTADQADRLGQWGRNLARAPGSGAVVDNQPHEVRLGTLWPTASRLGLAGIGLAVLAPLVLPAGGGLFDGVGGSGDGSGDGTVRIDNPMVTIKRDLERGQDVPVVEVRTDDPAPEYLRLTVLDEFDGTAWKQSERDVPRTNSLSTGSLPAPPGLTAGTRQVPYSSEFTTTANLDSRWLPLPYPATSVSVDGDWRFATDTLDVVAFDRDLDAARTSYDVDSLFVEPTSEELASAAPAPRAIQAEGTDLPDTLPDEVRRLAAEVTAGARSPYEEAVLLQRWFRDTGNFTYSVARSSTGNSTRDLLRFLGTGPDSRTGYCEQFSSSMAMMARSLGIPARVAVGFLRPDPTGPDTWVYSSHDLHAWPELYFAGAGWIVFEPTPQARDTVAPSYTLGTLAGPEEQLTPSAGPTTTEPRPTRPEAPEPSTAATGTQDAGLPAGWWLPFPALALVGLAFLPRAWRAALRRRRYAAHTPAEAAEGAWAELRATALDLRLGWDDGATLRRRARGLLPALRPTPTHHRGATRPTATGTAADPEAVEALEQLVLLVERSRYSRSGLSTDQPETLQRLTSTVTAALREAATPRSRRRATWVPASLWRSGAREPVSRRRPGVVGTSAGVESEPEPDRVSL